MKALLKKIPDSLLLILIAAFIMLVVSAIKFIIPLYNELWDSVFGDLPKWVSLLILTILIATDKIVKAIKGD